MLKPRILTAGMALCLVFSLCATSALAAHNPNPAPATAEQIALIQAALPKTAPAKPKKPRKVLVFWLCEGFFHNAIPVGNKAMEMLGAQTGAFETVISDDPAMLRPENLNKFDAILFNSTSRLEETYGDPVLRKALLDFVNSGKGVVGIHAGADNFDFWPEAACMIGGVFQGHPWTSGGTWAVKLDEPKHPFNESFGGTGFLIRDEIYQFKSEPYSRGKLRVLASLDMSNARNFKVRDPEKLSEDLDIGITWYHEVGKGRAFYCSLGHNPDVYWNRAVLRHYLAGIQYALGDYPMDATASADLDETPKPARFAEVAEEGWTQLTRKGLMAWRLPKGGWRVTGGAKQQPRDAKKLAGVAGKGVLLNGPKGRTSNVLSKIEHGDIEAHIEFMVPEGSNSGVYFQGRYEIQVFDSYGAGTPKYSDCGGIYQRWTNGKGYEGHAPRVNAATAPGTWQTFDVQFQAARFDGGGKKKSNAKFIKVVHNGVLIHENVEVTGPTRAAFYADERPFGPLMLQGDHGPVAYRNIRIRPLALAQVAETPLTGPYKKLLGYDFGKPRTPLAAIETEIRGAAQRKQRAIETKLLTVLQSEDASFAAKQFVCRMLRRMGSAKSIPALEDALYDAELSHMARFALEGMPFAKAGIVLRTALRHLGGDALVGVIGTVGARADAKAVPQLASISEPGASVIPDRIAAAEAAIAALGKIGTAEAADALNPQDPKRETRRTQAVSRMQQQSLIRAIENAEARSKAEDKQTMLQGVVGAMKKAMERFEGQAEEREAIAARLGALRAGAYLECADALAEAGNTRRAIAIYYAMSAHGWNDALRAAAYRGLAHAAPDQAVRVTASLLHGGTPVLRGMGAKLAAELEGPVVTVALAWELEDLPPVSQALLLAALGARADKQAEPQVKGMAGSKHEAVRIAALRTLATVGGAKSVAVLLEAAGKGGAPGEAASESLLRINGGGVDGVLIAHIRQGEQPVRLAAIRAIEARRVRGAIPPLMSVTEEQDAELLAAAYAGLGAMGTDAELPQLMEQLNRAQNGAVRGAIEKALTSIALRAENRDRICTLLLQRLPSANTDARVALVNVLGGLHTDAALNALRTQYEGGNGDLKKAVIRAMAAWDHAAPALMLKQIASSDEERTRRILALRGYIGLVKLPSQRPTGNTVVMLMDALRLAERTEERKAAIGALATAPSQASLELANSYAGDEALKDVAEAAAKAIEKALKK